MKVLLKLAGRKINTAVYTIEIEGKFIEDFLVSDFDCLTHGMCERDMAELKALDIAERVGIDRSEIELYVKDDL